MDKTQIRKLERFQRSTDFITRHASDLAPVMGSAAQVAFFDIVERLERCSYDQDASITAARSQTDVKGDLRDRLITEHMQPITAVARATLADTPEIVRLRLPRRRIDDARLIQRAGAMAAAAAKYKEVFLANHLPDDFIDQLNAAIAAVKGAVLARANHAASARVASEAMDDLIAQATAQLRIINALVIKAAAENGPLLAGWVMMTRLKPRASSSRANDGTTAVLEFPVVTPAAEGAAATPPVAQAA